MGEGEPASLTERGIAVLAMLVRFHGVAIDPAQLRHRLGGAGRLDARAIVRAARDLGWTDVPLLGATEVDKPGAPPRCIRVLLHWNTSRRQDEIVHVYLRGSDVMRAQDPPSHLASAAHQTPGA